MLRTNRKHLQPVAVGKSYTDGTLFQDFIVTTQLTRGQQSHQTEVSFYPVVTSHLSTKLQPSQEIEIRN